MESLEIEERALNARRKPRLEYYEREIEKRGKDFSNILRELRDDPLKPYLFTHKNLEEYLEDRWGMTARRQQQLLKAKTVREQLAEEMPEHADAILGMNEGTTRELGTAPKEQRAAIFKAAIEDTPKPQAKTMKAAKARVVGTHTNLPMTPEGFVDGNKLLESPPATKPIECCPTCKRPL